MVEVLTGVLLVVGAAFGVIAALGLVRMPDVLIRMHGSTKIGTLACGTILAGAAVHFAAPEIIVRVVAIVLFLLLTAPIAAHMIGRSVISTGVPLWQAEGPDAEDVQEQILEERVEDAAKSPPEPGAASGDGEAPPRS